MSVPFFSAEDLSSQEEIVLGEESSRHLAQVLRMKAGEQISVTNGLGHAIIAETILVHKNHCTVRRLSGSFVPRRSPVLTIALSLTKNTGRFEWFLEKATELGVAGIIPMLCDRTEKQHARHDRLMNICKSAMLQSRQVWMPVIHPAQSAGEVIRNSGDHQKLIAYVPEKINMLTDALKAGAGSHIILIGPEGDFTEEEAALAKQYFFEAVSLGRTILRVETAGIYAAVVHAANT